MVSKTTDLQTKLENLKKQVKKKEELVKNEEKLLKEKYLVERICLEELKVQFKEMNKIVNFVYKFMAYDYQIHFDKYMFCNKQTGRLSAYQNNTLLK